MDVHLLVYDLSRGLARQMSQGMLGFHLDAIYHTSILLNGREYVYDGGIVDIVPGSSHLGQPMERIYLGKTELPMEVIEEFLDSLRPIFTVESYDLWKHNCNNFSDSLAQFLLGKGIPEHIVKMPDAVLNSPLGRMLMPQLNQTINSNRQNGSILGIQNNAATNGYGSAPQPTRNQSHVKVVSSSHELDVALESAKKSCAVVLFTSATCPPCKVIAPVFDELSSEAAGKASFIKVDVAQLTPLPEKNYPRATPTFVTYLHGEKENEWAGADPAALRGNVQLLLQMAWPRHPHESLNLPSFSSPNSRPVLYAKVPPLSKLLAKMGPTANEPAIQELKAFIEARDQQGPAAAVLPHLGPVSDFVKKSIAALPVEILFTIVDLFRCALVDARFSGYFAEEKGHETVLTILNHVNSHSNCPYALRLVTLQMACNFFSTPLFPEEILRNEALRAPIIQLISSSFLDDSHNNVRVSASSLMFNLALASNKARREQKEDGLPEGDSVELVASVLEAIGQEESSPEALQGMLLALGNLVYCMPPDSEVADLLRTMDAGDAILAKKVNKPARPPRLGMWATHRQRFRAVLDEITTTLRGLSLDQRLMPVAASEMPTLHSSASTPSLRSHDAPVRMDGGNVRVVVRVRAFLPREIQRGAECLVEMDPVTQQTTLLVPNDLDPANAKAKARKIIEEKTFTFDNSFWSHDVQDKHYAHQEDVYNSLGEEFLDHNFEGYHTCIFAYGQTGSGKSYTMMGTPDQPGLIPRTCEDLFERIEAAQNETPNISYNVRVSYFEVYNEHVRDLLVPVNPNQPPYYLKIRESPTEGPYVKDLTEVPVRNLNEILRYMTAGDRSRTVASTRMNDTSSRSHAVFTIMLKQIHHDMETDETTERSSRIRLVDLAGSERAKATEATGQRLREGSNINKSLTTLGRVIGALADAKPGSRKRNKDVVPYRDSILTWLLKDSLGGNSKTAMIACIAPSDYEETLSTLRYADCAKRIRTRAVVNQDHISSAERDAQIAAMAEEIRVLQLSVSESRRREKDTKDQEEKLEEYQNRVVVMQRMMEERSLVAEGKIRSLQTENEALRLHLKLALESLKNPIPAVTVKEMEEEEAEDETGAEGKEDKENPEDGESLYDDSDDTAYDSDVMEDNASDMQDYMRSLLSDLGMFRRKIGDDKERWVGPVGPAGTKMNT
ncbi:kinesin motor domain-containing protein [Colletotrichum musicola]|uniref:Kinesin motor domain-containing protein n=1 Tax=Colletotrichum musicola TaxID=2175873 RepID=A0A8H6NWD4_9PEZI|nr:kinesin motor domain-containing protein [Colletotrichum musicola]